MKTLLTVILLAISANAMADAASDNAARLAQMQADTLARHAKADAEMQKILADQRRQLEEMAHQKPRPHKHDLPRVKHTHSPAEALEMLQDARISALEDAQFFEGLERIK